MLVALIIWPMTLYCEQEIDIDILHDTSYKKRTNKAKRNIYQRKTWDFAFEPSWPFEGFVHLESVCQKFSLNCLELF